MAREFKPNATIVSVKPPPTEPHWLCVRLDAGGEAVHVLPLVAEPHPPQQLPDVGERVEVFHDKHVGWTLIAWEV